MRAWAGARRPPGVEGGGVEALWKFRGVGGGREGRVCGGVVCCLHAYARNIARLAFVARNEAAAGCGWWGVEAFLPDSKWEDAAGMRQDRVGGPF